MNLFHNTTVGLSSGCMFNTTESRYFLSRFLPGHNLINGYKR